MKDSEILFYSLEAEPVWIYDEEGELIFFCVTENGQVVEWVWL